MPGISVPHDDTIVHRGGKWHTWQLAKKAGCQRASIWRCDVVPKLVPARGMTAVPDKHDVRGKEGA
jgi:hypothetical protein